MGPCHQWHQRVGECRCTAAQGRSRRSRVRVAVSVATDRRLARAEHRLQTSCSCAYTLPERDQCRSFSISASTSANPATTNPDRTPVRNHNPGKLAASVRPPSFGRSRLSPNARHEAQGRSSGKKPREKAHGQSSGANPLARLRHGGPHARGVCSNPSSSADHRGPGRPRVGRLTCLAPVAVVRRIHVAAVRRIQ